MTCTFSKEDTKSPELNTISIIPELLSLIVIIKLSEFLIVGFFIGSLFSYYKEESYAVYVLLHQTIKFWFSKLSDYYDKDYKKIDLELCVILISLVPYIVWIIFG